jgi:hypothetical protein
LEFHTCAILYTIMWKPCHACVTITCVQQEVRKNLLKDDHKS